jgi:hypothetical protein
MANGLWKDGDVDEASGATGGDLASVLCREHEKRSTLLLHLQGSGAGLVRPAIACDQTGLADLAIMLILLEMQRRDGKCPCPQESRVSRPYHFP